MQIVRFKDKQSHQIFLEPEGRTIPELYVQVILYAPHVTEKVPFIIKAGTMAGHVRAKCKALLHKVNGES